MALRPHARFKLEEARVCLESAKSDIELALRTIATAESTLDVSDINDLKNHALTRISQSSDPLWRALIYAMKGESDD